MKQHVVAAALALACIAPLAAAQQPSPSTDSPYTVLKRARVGGEGGTDYIYADVTGRRLFIPRGASRAIPATDSTPAVPAAEARVAVYDIGTLALIGEVAGTGGHGAVVDPKSNHGFSSSNPISMFDTKTLTLIKKIDPGTANPDGIMFDPYNERVYVFSHPTKNATVIDAKTGDVVGTIDLGGTPEEAVADGKGMVYVVMQDPEGSVAVVDAKTMKTLKHFPFNGHGSCNGLALDAKHHVLFAACARTGDQAQPMMVILSATDGKILADLPIAGSSDGALFNPATMEAFTSHSNGTLTVVKEKSPTSFEVEENLQTMNGARTSTLDTKTNHIFVMSAERGPTPPPPPGGEPAGRGGRGGRGGFAPPIPGSFTILEIGKP